jgi:hypothetical protein
VGLTLLAILTAALLLPGLVAVAAFYAAAETKEVDVPIPALSTADGIARVGVFALLVHLIYIGLLAADSVLPSFVPLPQANPYQFFSTTVELGGIEGAFSLLGGLLFLSVLAYPVGRMVGWFYMTFSDQSIFYGPMTDLLAQAQGDNAFITAYVISKIAEGDRLVGYQGTIVSIVHDDDRYPKKLVLKDVVPFYLKLGDAAPARIESKQPIDWITLTADDWHNVAFRVFRVEGEEITQEDAEPLEPNS